MAWWKEHDLWDLTHLTPSYSRFMNMDVFLTSVSFSVLIFNIMLIITVMGFIGFSLQIVIGNLKRKIIYWLDVGEILRIYGKTVKPGLRRAGHWAAVEGFKRQKCFVISSDTAAVMNASHCFSLCPWITQIKFQSFWEESPIGLTWRLARQHRILYLQIYKDYSLWMKNNPPKDVCQKEK